MYTIFKIYEFVYYWFNVCLALFCLNRLFLCHESGFAVPLGPQEGVYKHWRSWKINDKNESTSFIFYFVFHINFFHIAKGDYTIWVKLHQLLQNVYCYFWKPCCQRKSQYYWGERKKMTVTLNYNLNLSSLSNKTIRGFCHHTLQNQRVSPGLRIKNRKKFVLLEFKNVIWMQLFSFYKIINVVFEPVFEAYCSVNVFEWKCTFLHTLIHLHREENSAL